MTKLSKALLVDRVVDNLIREYKCLPDYRKCHDMLMNTEQTEIDMHFVYTERDAICIEVLEKLCFSGHEKFSEEIEFSSLWIYSRF